MTAHTKTLFLKGRLGTSIVSPQFEIFLILLYFLRCQVVEIDLLINVFAEFWSHAFVFWRYVICLRASCFTNVMKFASHLPKWGRKTLVKNLLWQVRKFWFQRREDRSVFWRGYMQFLEKIKHCIYAAV